MTSEPMAGQVRKVVIDYATIARPMLLDKSTHQELLDGITGGTLSGAGIYERVIMLM